MPAPVYCFDGWRLNVGRRELFNPAGQYVPMPSGIHDLLVVFCKHSQSVMTRRELIEMCAVGSYRMTQDRSIDVAVTRLRRTIDIDPKRTSVIQSIRYAGYYFTPEVTIE